MTESRLDPLLLQCRTDTGKSLKLQSGIILRVLCLLIGAGKMSENTSHVECRVAIEFRNFVNGLQKGLLIYQIADSAHAGVNSHMGRNTHTGSTGSVRQSCRILRGDHGLCDLFLRQNLCVSRRSIAQNEDRLLNICLPQCKGLLQTGNTQPALLIVSQRLGDLYGAVAISICLYNAHQPAVGGNQLFQKCVVFFQSGQIDLCPTAFLGNHKRFLSLIVFKEAPAF